MSQHSAARGSSSYLPHVDGLRALAVCLVVLYHAHVPGFQLGFLGVDIFFVISGFVITRNLVTELNRTNSISLTSFYARRARRLIPLQTLVLLVTLLVGYVQLLPFGEQQILALSAITSMMFASNFFFVHMSAGYFTPTADHLHLVHTWSLAVEEQFYLLWPAFILGLFRHLTLPNARFLSLLIICGLVVISVTLAVVGFGDTPSSTYYLLPSRVYELGAGAALAIAAPRSDQLAHHRPPAVLISVVALLSIGWSLTQSGSPGSFPGYLALLPTCATVLLIIEGASTHSLVGRALSAPPIAWLGRVSYGWYLWHWPALVFYRQFPLVEDNWVTSIGVVVATLPVAALTYYLIELPIRERRWKAFAGTHETLRSSAVLILCVVLIAGAFGANAKYLAQDDPKYDAFVKAAFDRHYTDSDCMALFGPFTGLPSRTNCTTGSDRHAPLVLIWGDSHADHFVPLVNAHREHSPLQILERARSGCPPLPGFRPNFLDPDEYRDCAAFNHAVMEELREIARTRDVVVVLAARWASYLAEHPVSVADRGYFARVVREQTLELEGHFLASTNRLLDELSDIRIRALIVGQVPELRFDAARCLYIWKRDADVCGVDRAVQERYLARSHGLLKTAASNRSNISFIEEMNFFCSSERCLPKKGAITLYYDDDHLSRAGAIALEAAIEKDLVRLLAGG